MGISEKQLKANQENAKKSTGPQTKSGKAVVSKNALKHGILSGRAVLDWEDEEQYMTLFMGLQHSLRPVGVMEEALVEKIAVNLWRQQRVRHSETATIRLQQEPYAIAKNVSSELLNSSSSLRRVTPEDFEAPDKEQIAWCEQVIQEIDTLVADSRLELGFLQQDAKETYEQLARDAKEDGCTTIEYLEDTIDGLAGYVVDLRRYCKSELDKVDRHELIERLAGWVKDKRSIPVGEIREKLSRYQASLDNELYKALKALRESQTWRMETLDTVAVENGFVSSSSLENEHGPTAEQAG